MFKTSMTAACMIAALLTGHTNRALAEKLSIRGQSIEVSEKAANGLVCREKWQQLKAAEKPTAAQLQALEYGNQYFMKTCKREMTKKN